MNRSRHTSVCLLLSCLTVALAACGGGGGNTSPPASGAPAPAPAPGPSPAPAPSPDPAPTSGEAPTASEDNPAPAQSSGVEGRWENVTPASVSLDPQTPGGGDNYGVQDLLADPMRPQDLYAFICYQGVWRSTDYGLTWTQVNRGEGWGKPWGAAIQPTTQRDPRLAPILYATASLVPGVLKSADFGKTWVTYRMPPEVIDGRGYPYSVDIDPYDPEHILVAFHESPDIAESTTGGKSWKLIRTPRGSSFYPFFIRTGNRDTTRRTWLAVPQIVAEGTAARTEDGGITWTSIGKFQHQHGSAQIVDRGDGTLYMASRSPDGIHKSSDYGKTWKTISTASTGVVAAGRTHLYTSLGLGWGSRSNPLDPMLFSASLDRDEAWAAIPAPQMPDGAKRLAVTHDASHDIVVGGNWHAGIWRYKQPHVGPAAASQTTESAAAARIKN